MRWKSVHSPKCKLYSELNSVTVPVATHLLVIPKMWTYHGHVDSVECATAFQRLDESQQALAVLVSNPFWSTFIVEKIVYECKRICSHPSGRHLCVWERLLRAQEVLSKLPWPYFGWPCGPSFAKFSKSLALQRASKYARDCRYVALHELHLEATRSPNASIGD